MVREVVRALRGEEVLLEPSLARNLRKRPGTVQALRRSDAIITVGGDGTVLFAQRLAPNVPILGINLGGRGFLADVSPNDAQRALRMLRAGKLQLVERERLAAVARGRRLPDALNDVVVCSAQAGKTVALRVSIDGKLAMEVRGDGVIVATPTGSTAYAHAAGGPVIDPRLKVALVVPICPSHPGPSPLIAPVDSRIEVEPTQPGRDALVIVDGNPAAKLRYREKIKIHRSDNPARFFEWSEFYRKSREKL
ncbi:MAG: NAD(+)/NADH kinase [Candidatus Hodarchaeaceae archaeon]|nr:NAD(+)/NADH kinase [Candidatus Hodarchaeaceae archaeon]